MPPRADCHAHIFDAAYEFAPNPRYIPEPCLRGTASQFAAVLDAHGFTHGLILAAEPYGGDNGHVLDAVAAFPGRFKGIAVLHRFELTDRELADLSAREIVGIRVNLAMGTNVLQAPGFDRLLGAMRELGWLLDIHSIGDDLAAASHLLEKVPVPMVFDHFGRPDPERGLSQAGFQALLRFGQAGRGVVKLSGPFRAGSAQPPYRQADPFVEAAIRAFGLDNCVWGSDWPFVNLAERVDYGPPLACLQRWLPDQADQQKVLWEAPSRIFGFIAD